MIASQNGRKEDKKRDVQKAPQKKSPEKNMSEIDEHILKRFDIKKRLGKGAYGIVWKAVDRKSKDTVAIKKIFDAFRNQTDAQRTFREIIFLQAFRNHPNIVKLHSIHRALNNRDIYLGFEYMETDLHCVIKRGNILKDVHKRYIMYQILKATKYIHSGNVIHRDQKPSNVLIDSACRVKLADFGLARSVSSLYRGGGGSGADEADCCLTDYVATRWYRAPEILIASKNYTKGIDMWSLGCILGEMLTGKPLFPGSSTVNQLERIMAALPRPDPEDVASVCSGYGSSLLTEAASSGAGAPGGASLGALLSCAPRDAADLVQRLLVFNPGKRLSAEDALQHDYVKRFHCSRSEPSLNADVVLPLRDDKQVSVDDYRNKLYSLMARPRHNAARNNHSSPPQPQPQAMPAPTKASRSYHGAEATQLHKKDKVASASCEPRRGGEHPRAPRPPRALSTAGAGALPPTILRRDHERARGDCRSADKRTHVLSAYPPHPTHSSHPSTAHTHPPLIAPYAQHQHQHQPQQYSVQAHASRRNSSSFSQVGFGDGSGGRAGGYGVITASAFMDLRTTMR